MRKSSHIDRYEHGERSMLVFTPTVMNMENGRCEMTFSMLSHNFLNAFARFSSLFQTTITLIPAYHCLSFSEQEDGKVVMSN